MPISGGDIVGFTGKGFIILRLAKKAGRDLPAQFEADKMEMFGVLCPPCVVKNDQKVEIADKGIMTPYTLHDICGEWQLRPENGKVATLQDGTWFEIRNPVL